MTNYRNPPTAVDIVIQVYIDHGPGIFDPAAIKEALKDKPCTLAGIVLIQRKNEPFKGKWALPGGFQEYGDSLEKTAIKEAKEETGLDIVLLEQLKTYSEPDRDPRGHVNAVGYVASVFIPAGVRLEDVVKGGDDAARAKVFSLDRLPKLAFDHAKRIEEYKAKRYPSVAKL